MHAIMPCTTTLSSTDAGRRLPSVAIFTIPTARTPKSIHIAADDLKVALDVQVIDPVGNTPVATSPVPMNARVNAVRGLAILNRRKAAPAQDDRVFIGSSLEHDRTLNRMDALAILEGRKPRPAQDNLVFGGSSSLDHAKALNRMEALAKLEGRKSDSPAQEEEDLVLAESPVSSLKRVRTINKQAGLDIIARRESRKARLFGGPILQAYLRR